MIEDYFESIRRFLRSLSLSQAPEVEYDYRDRIKSDARWKTQKSIKRAFFASDTCAARDLLHRTGAGAVSKSCSESPVSIPEVAFDSEILRLRLT